MKEVTEMKVKETVDSIGFIAAVGALTVGVAVVGAVQAAAAAVDLLILGPLAYTRTVTRVTRPTVVATRTERIEIRTSQAA
ncbi:MAG TPA: hypothetical protein VIO62_14360 [Candidatus Dormibacteraeota bacterium]